MKEIDEKRMVRKIQITGLTISLIILIAGLLLYMTNPQESDIALPLRELPSSLADVNPTAVIDLGILVLIFTPIAVVIGTIISNITNNKREFALAGLFVLILLIISFGLSFLR